jgi:hypothetical protein
MGVKYRRSLLREKRGVRLFVNRVLRRIFVSKRDEVTGEWRKLHNEELCDQNSSPNIFRLIKSRRMICAGHVTCFGKRNLVYMILVGNTERNRTFGRPGLDKKIITKLIFRIWIEGHRLCLSDSDRYRRREIWNAVMNFGFLLLTS